MITTLNLIGQTDYMIIEETEVETQIAFQDRKRIGIIGGTFSPPHLGHLIVAQQVGEQLGLDKIYFMPDAEPPHIDEKESISAKHRESMVRLSIEGNPLFDIETIELARGGKSFTIDTMKFLTAMHPDTDYYFIIGGDMVEYLPKWRNIDELVQLVQFVGVARPGYGRESIYPIIWVDAPLIDISSTEIRKMVKTGRSIRYLVKEDVKDYILKEGLYLDDED